VKDQRNEYFINDLREGSELLWQSYQRFTQCVKLKGCLITSCYELRDTQRVMVDVHTGRWARSGETVRVVTRESATFALPTEPIHMQLGIDADHSNMVKFTDNCDHHYITVRDRLSECVRNAPSIIEARFAITGANHEGGFFAHAYLESNSDTLKLSGLVDIEYRLSQLVDGKLPAFRVHW